jgi:cholesterol oxidase
MADDPDDGVTDPDGKVRGTRALYVLDGAAIPSSLGTNPSATIAAVAERNVRKALDDPASPIHAATPLPLDRGVPGWPPDVTVAEIQRRLGQTREVLDPIAGVPPSPSEDPRSAALGLGFDEVMRGFYAAGDFGSLPIRSEFRATIEDLNAFLVDPRRPVAITGTVWVTDAPRGPEVAYRAAGRLELLKQVATVNDLDGLLEEGRKLMQGPRTTPAAVTALESLVRQLESQVRRYEMEYDLRLTGPGPLTRLQGVKKIYGGPGLAAWTETTTLAVTLFQGPTAAGEGTMRVHLADFLKRQLPSFEVTGTTDDVRIAWAFGRFFRFFLGTLRQVYLPHLETLDPFGDRPA